MKALFPLALAILMLASDGCSFSPKNQPSVIQPTPRVSNTEAPAPLAAATTAPTSEILGELPTRTQPATQIPPTDAPQEIIAVSTIDLKVRTGPGPEYPQTGLLKKGTTVRLLGISQDSAWLQHDTGWSSADYLTTEADTSNLPVVLVEAPPTAVPALAPRPAPSKTQMPAAPPPSNCDPSYPTVCIPPPPPDLDCGDIPYRRFQVLPPDPHRFDADHDGIGCESG